jgi:uncharacterized SAM-binding protein YcdF (DUF218 family)
MTGMKEKNRKCGCLIWRIFCAIAVVFLLSQILVALVGPPQCVIEWLEMPEILPRVTPRNLVILGGGGIPSGSTLLRTYYAAQYGKNLTGTTFIVSLPADGDPETSSVGRMRDELVLRGIPSSVIRMEYRGLNTHQQAVNVQHLLGPEALDQPILIVTSGYHMRRAVDCFRKAGFTRVSGLLASEIGAEAEIGPWGWLRYGVWAHLEREIRVSRELAALATYKIEGWI